MENCLYKSNVIYDELEHSYTLEGKPLKGITGMLSRQLFPDKYGDVPEHILQEAARKGKIIHAEIEMWFNGFPPSDPSPEFLAFLRLVEKNGMEFSASEYIVTDREYFATPIDLVSNKKTIHIYDIKTTYALDEEYCAWQLSICAYLFELQNKHLKVGSISAIWLKGDKAKLVLLKRKDESEIIGLLEAEKNGLQFAPKVPDIGIKNDTLAAIIKAENEIKAIKANLDEATAKANELKGGLLRLMIDNGVTKYTGEGVTLTVKKAYERESLDSKRIKEELPELYARYSKKTTVKETLIIKTT
jgi:hypothetical protein